MTEQLWDDFIATMGSATGPAYNGIHHDFSAPGCQILGRAQTYLEQGTLLASPQVTNDRYRSHQKQDR